MNIAPVLVNFILSGVDAENQSPHLLRKYCEDILLWRFSASIAAVFMEKGAVALSRSLIEDL
ncbi:hypothetical protein SAMN05216420_101186 [Nitrosospira sp. Nl5]|nr:hypothetical protein SAMN05216420_101186 [Nitrosospira sp. Nl5]